MGIDHRGADILVPEQFLDGPDVVTVLKEMGPERMAERMATSRLGDPGVMRIRSCANVLDELFVVSPPETDDLRNVPSHG